MYNSSTKILVKGQDFMCVPFLSLAKHGIYDIEILYIQDLYDYTVWGG